MIDNKVSTQLARQMRMPKADVMTLGAYDICDTRDPLSDPPQYGARAQRGGKA